MSLATTLQTTLPGGSRFNERRWLTGGYYDFASDWSIGGAATTANTAGIIYPALLWVPRNNGIDRIVFNLSAASGAGKLARLGIYRNDPDGIGPKDLLVDYGTILADATGNRELTVDSGLPTNEWVFLAALFEEACTMTSVTANLPSLFGSTAFASGFRIMSTMAHAFGTLPQTFVVSAYSTAWRRIGVRAK